MFLMENVSYLPGYDTPETNRIQPAIWLPNAKP